jgi:hypothetical protein
MEMEYEDLAFSSGNFVDFVAFKSCWLQRRIAIDEFTAIPFRYPQRRKYLLMTKKISLSTLFCNNVNCHYSMYSRILFCERRV